MARTNKKTRIKGIPARIQLQQKDAITGSFPSNVRIASDNRTGDYSVQYDDLNTILFQEHTKQDLSFIDDIVAYYSFEDSTIASETNTVKYFSPQLISGSFSNLALSGSSESGKNTGHIEATPFSDIFTPNVKALDFAFDGETIDTGNSLFRTAIISGSDADVFNIEAGDTYSIAAWINIQGDAAKPGGTQPIFSRIPVTNTGSDTFSGDLQEQLVFGTIDLTGPRSLVLFMGDNVNTSSIAILSTDAFITSSKEWIHVACSYDGSALSSGMKLYLNGSEISSDDSSTSTFVSPSNAPQRIVVGNHNSGSTNINGYIDDIVFVRRELTADEIKELFEHKTNLTAPSDGINYGTGLNVGSKFFKDSEQATDITTDGKVVKGIGDDQASFTPGQALKPFRDNDRLASDAKGASNNKFFATGSAVTEIGEGFSQPLWSKNIIEIPMNTTVQSTLVVVTGAASASTSDPGYYPMGYYNFDKGVWEGVGKGIKLNSHNSLTESLETTTVGFSSPGVFPGPQFGFVSNAGLMVNNFGFPHHPKFHATSSQTIKLENHISKPFLLEKVVMTFSASYSIGDVNVTDIDSNDFSVTASLNNFFILNQRKAFLPKTFSKRNITGPNGGTKIESLETKIPNTIQLTSGSEQVKVNTIRELVTFGGVSSYASGARDAGITIGAFGDPFGTVGNFFDSDLIIESNISNVSGSNWSGSFALEVPVRSPISTLLFSTAPSSFSDRGVVSLFETTDEGAGIVAMELDEGGRNGLGMFLSTGRSFREEFSGGEIRTLFSKGFNFVSTTFKSKTNPYLLFPQDELIVGWQLPHHDEQITLINDSTNGTGSLITFHPGNFKLTLYGSELREGKEFHDTLNQLLISEAAHEVIE